MGERYLACPYPPCPSLPALHALRTVHGLELEWTVHVHKHGSKTIQVRPAIVPLLDEWVTPERIERGVAWLASNWQGVEPMLPRELVAEA